MNILLPLLTVLFVGLKLSGQIAWAWFWVLSPTIIPLLFVLLYFILVLIIAAFGVSQANKKVKKIGVKL